jgi:hypothetical protein
MVSSQDNFRDGREAKAGGGPEEDWPVAPIFYLKESLLWNCHRGRFCPVVVPRRCTLLRIVIALDCVAIFILLWMVCENDALTPLLALQDEAGSVSRVQRGLDNVES